MRLRQSPVLRNDRSKIRCPHRAMRAFVALSDLTRRHRQLGIPAIVVDLDAATAANAFLVRREFIWRSSSATIAIMPR